MIDLKVLVKAGVHFGHQKKRWCPKMAPYIWGFKNNVHLIDVSKTAVQLEKAAQFLESVVLEGKSILWVGTKKAAQDIILNVGNSLKMPYVYHRWIGGTLSNNAQVKKSVTKLLHYQDIVSKSKQSTHYTKKEINVFQKLVERLSKNVGGIQGLVWPVGAVVLVDVRKERSALKEASIMGIPVVGLVDTNSDPTNVNYVIPANDDSPRSIAVLIDYLSEAVARGTEKAKQKIAKEREDIELAKKHKKEAQKVVVEVKEAAPKKAAPSKDVSVAPKKSAVAVAQEAAPEKQEK